CVHVARADRRSRRLTNGKAEWRDSGFPRIGERDGRRPAPLQPDHTPPRSRAQRGGPAGQSARRSSRDALVPPNPKELESTTSIFRLRATCGTRSIAVSTDGLSRLRVGGATWSRIARIE